MKDEKDMLEDDWYDEEELASEDYEDDDEMDDSKPSKPSKTPKPTQEEMEDPANLSFDNNAYRLFHSCDCELPCMTMDSLFLDNRLAHFNRPPYDVMCVAASYNKNAKNKLYVMRLKDLHETKYDDEVSDDDSIHKDADIYHCYVKLKAPALRCRANDKYSHLVAVNCENQGSYVYDIGDAKQMLEEDRANFFKNENKTHSFCYNSAADSFGLAWEQTEGTAIAIGSENGELNILRGDNGSFQLAQSYHCNTGSVEDINWCPYSTNLLAAVSADSTLKLFDLREKNPVFTKKYKTGVDINVLSWNKKTPSLLAVGLDDGSIYVELLDKISENPCSETVAYLSYHDKPICSMQFHTQDDSVLALACEDNRVTYWDLSVEQDATKEMYEGKELPQQLMFDHRGMSQPKEIVFDKNIPNLLLVTGLAGFNVFQPDDVDDD